MSMGIADRPRRRPSAQPSGRKSAGKVKSTILLTAENDFRLTVLAASRGVDRSAVVNEALEDLLRGIVVSFRGRTATADDSPDRPEAAG